MSGRSSAAPHSSVTALLKFFWVGLTSLGAARWTYLHAAFVRTGWIREDVFFRDLALSQTLPGAVFANLTVLCGLRIHGVRLGIAGLVLALLPGIVTICAAMLLVSTPVPVVSGLLQGVLLGAVGVLAATFVSLSASRLSNLVDSVIAVFVCFLVIGGWSVGVVVPLLTALGAWYYLSHPAPARGAPADEV